jgi:hypothetical protein
MGLRKQHSSIDLVLAINLLWLGGTTFSIATLSLTIFSIMTVSIKGLFVTLSINGIQHKINST